MHNTEKNNVLNKTHILGGCAIYLLLLSSTSSSSSSLFCVRVGLGVFLVWGSNPIMRIGPAPCRGVKRALIGRPSRAVGHVQAGLARANPRVGLGRAGQRRVRSSFFFLFKYILKGTLWKLWVFNL